jgi:hypothetical protein
MARCELLETTQILRNVPQQSVATTDNAILGHGNDYIQFEIHNSKTIAQFLEQNVCHRSPP